MKDPNSPTKTVESAQAGKVPSLGEKIYNAASAYARWAAAGFPTRDKKSIQAIYKQCEACKDEAGNPVAIRRTTNHMICGICRCPLRKSSVVDNKIAMATERCPKGIWVESV